MPWLPDPWLRTPPMRYVQRLDAAVRLLESKNLVTDPTDPGFPSEADIAIAFANDEQVQQAETAAANVAAADQSLLDALQLLDRAA